MKLINYKNRILNHKGKILNSEKRNSLLSGLVDYWSLDSGASTSTGSGNNGTITGATSTSGKISNGYSFDASGNNVIATTNTLSAYNFIHSTVNFSVSFWLKLNSYDLDSARVIIANNAGGSANVGILITYDNRSIRSSPKAIGLFITKGISGVPIVNYTSQSDVIQDNNWHHIVITCSSTSGGSYTVIPYIDGFLKSGTLSEQSTPINTNASYNLTFGQNNNPSFRYPLNGILDELGIWNRPLLHEEVLQLYNAGAGKQYPF